jgi:hypothetical protein
MGNPQTKWFFMELYRWENHRTTRGLVISEFCIELDGGLVICCSLRTGHYGRHGPLSSLINQLKIVFYHSCVK